MDHLLSEEEARRRLKELCEQAGGVSNLAKEVGVTISNISMQLHGRRPIQGKLAEYMGIKSHRETIIKYKRVDDDQ